MVFQVAVASVVSIIFGVAVTLPLNHLEDLPTDITPSEKPIYYIHKKEVF